MGESESPDSFYEATTSEVNARKALELSEAP